MRSRSLTLPNPLTLPGRRRWLWYGLTRGWRVLLTLGGVYRATVGSRARAVLVTGSYGKTTTTRALRAVFGLPLDRWTELNTNCLGEIGWTLMREPPWRRFRVVEAGAGTPGRMRHYARAIRPDATIITWLGREHLAAFGNLEALRDEKAEAVRALSSRGTAILNADDPQVRWMATQTRARVVWFGCDPKADIRATEVRLDWPHGLRFNLQVEGQERPVRLRLMGRRMIYPALAAIAAGLDAGVPLELILTRLSVLTPTPGRLQPLPGPAGSVLLRDDYKATPDTVETAMELLKEVPARRRWVVLGSLNNLPSADIDGEYARVGEMVARGADQVLVVGEDWDRFEPGLRRGAPPGSVFRSEPGVHEAIALLQAELGPGDVVLVKGYEDQGLTRIILALQGQTVRCALTWCGIRHQRCDDCPYLASGLAPGDLPGQILPSPPGEKPVAPKS
jgi:UDP-N-acetylmuramoyl-tripeptide--D-alanyl-D-alanine ligase